MEEAKEKFKESETILLGVQEQMYALATATSAVGWTILSEQLHRMANEITLAVVKNLEGLLTVEQKVAKNGGKRVNGRHS